MTFALFQGLLYYYLTLSLFDTPHKHQEKVVQTMNTEDYAYANIGYDLTGYYTFGMGGFTLNHNNNTKIALFVEYKMPDSTNQYWFDKVGFDFQKTFFDDRFGIGGGDKYDIPL